MEPPQLVFGLTKQDLLAIAEILVLSIVAILTIVLVVRPLLKAAFTALRASTSSTPSTGPRTRLPLEDRICRNCVYWRRSRDARGHCRRHAPVVGPDGALWPPTAETDGCGEFIDPLAFATSNAGA